VRAELLVRILDQHEAVGQYRPVSLDAQFMRSGRVLVADLAQQTPDQVAR
jgi:hypothetical protein